MFAGTREIIWHKFWNTARPNIRLWLPSIISMFDAMYYRYEIWRVNKVTTGIFGHRWRRSVRRLEIDLTYACNLRCNDCNRSVAQAPSSAHLTARNIREFLDESIQKRYHWEMIRLLGGEPTLHPEFLSIIEMLLMYKKEHERSLRIEVITNGYGIKVNSVLQKIPSGVVVRNTNKKGNEQDQFEPFNRAPIDLREHANTDFANGCWVTQYCGMGLTPMGYYHCAVAGGIDRIFQAGIGRSSIPEPDDRMHREMSELCRYCGHFCKQSEAIPREQRITSSWRAAYASLAPASAHGPLRTNRLAKREGSGRDRADANAENSA